MSTLKRYTDWQGWWIGLRKNLMKCIGTTGTAWLGTNVLAVAGVPVPGIDWKQAGAMFAVHIGFEIFTYLKTTEPTVIEERDDQPAKPQP